MVVEYRTWIIHKISVNFLGREWDGWLKIHGITVCIFFTSNFWKFISLFAIHTMINTKNRMASIQIQAVLQECCHNWSGTLNCGRIEIKNKILIIWKEVDTFKVILWYGMMILESQKSEKQLKKTKIIDKP